MSWRQCWRMWWMQQRSLMKATWLPTSRCDGIQLTYIPTAINTWREWPITWCWLDNFPEFVPYFRYRMKQFDHVQVCQVHVFLHSTPKDLQQGIWHWCTSSHCPITAHQAAVGDLCRQSWSSSRKSQSAGPDMSAQPCKQQYRYPGRNVLE